MLGFKTKRRTREIFRYWDGVKDRSIDPMGVVRAMGAHPEFNLEKHLPLLDCPDTAVAAEASAIAVAATRQAFGIEAWNEATETGLTEGETLGILNDFLLFIDDLKKNGSGQPT